MSQLAGQLEAEAKGLGRLFGPGRHRLRLGDAAVEGGIAFHGVEHAGVVAQLHVAVAGQQAALPVGVGPHRHAQVERRLVGRGEVI